MLDRDTLRMFLEIYQEGSMKRNIKTLKIKSIDIKKPKCRKIYIYIYILSTWKTPYLECGSYLNAFDIRFSLTSSVTSF